MAIGEQFAGLDMKNLIGGPLSAAAESSVVLANSTANFINKVGFNEDKTTRTVMFKFEKSDTDQHGNPLRNEMRLDVPMLAIVPIPNLQIDEVNILFDMEVKECSREETSKDYSGAFEGQANFGIFKVKVSGSVAAHSSNTRSTDNSAKYHVDLRAANHGTPEGLARVLDIMAQAAAPAVLSSKMVDADGKEADSAAKQKRTALNASYNLQQQIGASCKAANDNYESALRKFKEFASNTCNTEKMTVQTAINNLGDTDDGKQAQYVNLIQDITHTWERVQSNVKSTVETVYNQAATGSGEKKADDTQGAPQKIEDIFSIKLVTKDAASILTLGNPDDGKLSVLQTCFDDACKDFAVLKKQEDELAVEKANYNSLLMKK